VPTLTYPAAVRALQERGRFGVRLGLARTRALLGALDNPQLRFRGALVAGTNGKGSVIALASSALRAGGLRVGETPKPHLVSYRERAQIDGHPIPAGDFARLVAGVLSVAARIPSRLGEPTEFELLTAVIFSWFAEEGIDVALVEVGLGGRLDATHTWDGGVAVVTNVELDHMDRLGATIPLIAREKAAIIMRGDEAVTGAQGEGLAVVRRRARSLGVHLREVSQAPVLSLDRDGIVVDLHAMGPTRIGLRGRHQAANAAVADATLDALATVGIATATLDARRAGFLSARWPGRLELIDANGRDVLLDGAHNPAGAAALAQALDDLGPYLRGPAGSAAPLTLLIGVMADKDAAGIVRALAAAVTLRSARIICTRLDLGRALPADELAAHWRRSLPNATISVEPDVGRALDRALAEAQGPVVVSGSLYLVGAVRARLVDDPELRDPEETETG